MDKILKLRDITESSVQSEDGDKVYEVLALQIPNLEGKISIDFLGIQCMTSNFLASSFGKLIEVHGIDYVREHFKIINVTRVQKELLSKFFDSYKRMAS